MSKKAKKSAEHQNVKHLFMPLFLIHIKKSEDFLSVMEREGWQLNTVRFGCLLYFIPCKPKENTVYYLTQFSKYRFNEIAGTYGKKALEASFSAREIKRNETISFSLSGLGYSKMYYSIYRFTDNLETVNDCKKKRKKSLSYFADILLYICVNFVAPLIAISYIINKYLK